MTAPELLGIRNFQGDAFKVEAYAVGFLLYQIIYGKEAPWGSIAAQYFARKYPLGPPQREAQALLSQQVGDHVREVFARLDERNRTQQSLNPMERCEKVVAHLLNPDPALRWSVVQAKEELHAICAALEGKK
jgi:hypothetical protein